MDAPTALHTLELTFLDNLEKPTTPFSSILRHTKLTEFTMDLWFTDVSFIELMTSLRSLSICVFETGISTLACALPALHLLQYLSINRLGLSNDAVVLICCSLKAWTLPFLVDFVGQIPAPVTKGQNASASLTGPFKLCHLSNPLIHPISAHKEIILAERVFLQQR